jgi:FecR protein
MRYHVLMKRPVRTLAFGVTAALVSMSTLLVSTPRTSASVARSGELGIVKIILRGLGEKPPNLTLREAKVLDPVYTRYFLRTKSREKARLQFVDGTALNINQNTDAVLQDPNHTTVNQGEVDQVDKNGSTHRIQGGGAVATANGTNFDVRVVKGRIFFVVDRGRVTVTSAGASVKLARNQESIVIPRQRPGRPLHVNADAVIAWVRGLDTNGWRQIFGGTYTNRSFGEIDDIVYAPNGQLFARVTQESGAGRALIAELTTRGHLGRTFKVGGYTGLAVDRSNFIYVPTQKGIAKFTPSGHRVVVLGSTQISLNVPLLGGIHGVAVDSHGDLYVTGASAVRSGFAKVSPSGTIMGTLGSAGYMYENGVAVDRQDNVYAVTGKLAGPHGNIVEKFSPSGQLLARWTIVGDHNIRPLFDKIAIRRKGRIILTVGEEYDPSISGVTGNWSIWELSAKGVLRTIWRRPGHAYPAAGSFHTPDSVAVDARGNVYVADLYRIQKLPWFDT